MALISKDEILAAGERVRNGPLTIFHTPCIKADKKYEIFSDFDALIHVDFAAFSSPFLLRCRST